MNKIQLAKTATKIIVGAGTGRILKGIVQNNVSTDTIIDQVTVSAGSFVLGGMLAEASSEYTDAKIDQIAAWYQENINKDKITVTVL